MNPNCPEPPPRQKVPKDGWGPRGRPECYYTSRVLDSTARYVRFVKKLRTLEDEERIGLEDTTKKTNDFNFLSFFARCDRKALVNKVAHRVKLSLESYEDDLVEKRKRLSELLALEEEHNVALFVKQCQAGAELLWQDKMERLAYLLEKRQKECEDKYADIPLDKCVHLHPCLVAMRKRASRDVQLYQMREKQMRKEAEREFDKMWHDLAMKESDALAARMEYDTMERLRRDKENHEYTQYQVEMARQKRAKEQERLKQEALLLKADVEAYFREQEEEKRKKLEEARACGEAKKEMVRERKELLAKKNDEAKLMDDTRDLIAQSLAGADREEVERRRQKERDIDECNFRMAVMKNRIAEMKNDNEEVILQEEQRRRDAVDLKRCQNLRRSQKLKKEISDYNKKEHEIKMSAVEEQKKAAEALEYERQVRKQLDALVEHRELTQAQATKLHQKDLLQQIEYSKVLKERAMQEEIQERKKCEIAQREYQEAIERLLCRPFFSDRVHPFLQQMSSGLKLPETCPCGPPPGYCAESKKPQPPTKK